MKKKLLILFIFMGLSLTSYAQVYVGGSLGMGKIGGNHSVNVVPEVGYCIGEHNSVSISLGYSTYKESDTGDSYHSLNIMPCYTYVIPFGENKWCFDINTSVGYSRFFRANENLFGIYFGPQLEYNLTENWSMWASFDAISVECEWADGEPISTNLNFNWFNTGINFGFYYYF